MEMNGLMKMIYMKIGCKMMMMNQNIMMIWMMIMEINKTKPHESGVF